MNDPSSMPLDPASLQALRLFPLPETVLFPGTVLPLHVFEPRYRDMVADALENDHVVAVAHLKPGFEAEYDGRPPIHDVVGVGRIVHVQRLPDGRYHLALQGLGRARILSELPPDRTFRRAHAALMPDELPPGGEDDLLGDAETLRTCLARLVGRAPNRADALGELLGQLTSPGALADVVCAAALESSSSRQDALATADVRRRLQLATDAVAELMLRAQASGNDSLPV